MGRKKYETHKDYIFVPYEDIFCVLEEVDKCVEQFLLNVTLVGLGLDLTTNARRKMNDYYRK